MPLKSHLLNLLARPGSGMSPTHGLWLASALPSLATLPSSGAPSPAGSYSVLGPEGVPRRGTKLFGVTQLPLRSWDLAFCSHMSTNPLLTSSLSPTFPLPADSLQLQARRTGSRRRPWRWCSKVAPCIGTACSDSVRPVPFGTAWDASPGDSQTLRPPVPSLPFVGPEGDEERAVGRPALWPCRVSASWCCGFPVPALPCEAPLDGSGSLDDTLALRPAPRRPLEGPVRAQPGPDSSVCFWFRGPEWTPVLPPP